MCTKYLKYVKMYSGLNYYYYSTVLIVILVNIITVTIVNTSPYI